jgi:hypothetical protein
MGDVVLVWRQLDTLRSAAMVGKLTKYITPLLAAGAAVVAIAAAPMAFVACHELGTTVT